MSDTHRAVWSRRQPQTVVVADPAGKIVASLQITETSGRPSPLMLHDTEWAIYPGAAWAEEDDSPGDGLGEWSVAVFRNTQRAESGSGDAS